MELIEAGVDLSKAHYPWEAMDEVTGGLTGEDYIIYYGRPKSMKSWVLAEHASHTFDQGKKPLIYTKEMHPDNIFMRMAACQARLPYQEFRLAKLNADEKERLYMLKRMVDDMMKSDDMICLSGRDAPNGQDTVEWLQAKIEKYNPDVVFIDGIYLMTDSKGSKRQKDNYRVQNISRGLRDLVLSTEIPIVGTIQANRDAAKHQDANLDEIAFSDAIGQDATVAVRVINEKNKPTIALVLGGSREFSFHGCRIHGVPATNFGYIEELTEKEITKAKDGDVSGEEGGSTTAHARKPKNKAAAEARRRAKSNTKRHLRLVDKE
jgi:replicative DNA helicase